MVDSLVPFTIARGADGLLSLTYSRDGESVVVSGREPRDVICALRADPRDYSLARQGKSALLKWLRENPKPRKVQKVSGAAPVQKKRVVTITGENGEVYRTGGRGRPPSWCLAELKRLRALGEI